MDSDAIFEPLRFRNLTVKNRLFRSSISGRWDNEDGSGTQVRINWEERFARGGVGAIISSFVPVHRHGRMLSHYAMIDGDDHIPFWRRLGERVHAHDCKFILQLSHARGASAPPTAPGGNRRARGIRRRVAPAASPSRSSRRWAGKRSRASSTASRRAPAGRARRGSTGSSCMPRTAISPCAPATTAARASGGSLRDRYGFLREVIRAIRREVGDDFHLQVKMNVSDPASGSAVEEQLRICQWLEADGVDGLHVSAGSTFPLMPPGTLPVDELNGWYGGMQSSGVRGFFPNYTLLHYKLLRPLVRRLWQRTGKPLPAEAAGMALCREIRQRVGSR